MKRYCYDSAIGKLQSDILNPHSTLDEILIFTKEEFLDYKTEILSQETRFLHSLSQIQYCKIEIFPNCIQGTMRIPKPMTTNIHAQLFGFYLTTHTLYLIEKSHNSLFRIEDTLEHMKINTYKNCSLRQLLLQLFDALLEDDVLYLQKQEKELAELEESILSYIPESFHQSLVKYRKRLMYFHTYYQQLMNMGDTVLSSKSQNLTSEEKANWQLYSDRAERLHDYVEMLREYLIQIRELYQTSIDVKQNKTMSFLTMVTTIFFPLSLIAGWYGMNFPNMPEFRWNYSYYGVIIISIFLILIEIFYYKHRRN